MVVQLSFNYCFKCSYSSISSESENPKTQKLERRRKNKDGEVRLLDTLRDCIVSLSSLQSRRVVVVKDFDDFKA